MEREEFIKKIESLSEEDKDTALDWYDNCKGKKVQEIASNGTIAEILRNAKRYKGRTQYEHSRLNNNIVSAKPASFHEFNTIEECDDAIEYCKEMINTLEEKKKELLKELVEKYKDDIKSILNN